MGKVAFSITLQALQGPRSNGQFKLHSPTSNDLLAECARAWNSDRHCIKVDFPANRALPSFNPFLPRHNSCNSYTTFDLAKNCFRPLGHRVFDLLPIDLVADPSGAHALVL